VLASCGYEPEVERAGVSTSSDLSATQVLEQQGYTTLNAALEYAGLTDAIDGAADSITVFAPSNLAFIDLFARLGISELSELSPETVANLLSYHVVAGGFFGAGLPATMTTLVAGKSISSRGVVLNGKSTVTEADLVSRSGVIHGIDRVLEIPANDIMAALDADTDFSTLVTYIDAAGLRDVLATTANITLLAPNNAAFEAVGDLSGLTPEVLTEILSFHVVPGALLSSDFELGSKLASLLGTEANNIQEIVIGAELSFNGAGVLNPNIITDNGVVHKMSGAVLEDFEIADFLSPTVNGNVNDGISFDLIGDVVAGTGYAGFANLADVFSIYAPLFGPTYGDFASDAEAVTYIENQTFAGNVNHYTAANGTKVTAINGSSYFITGGAGAAKYFNDGARNAFGATSTTVVSGYNFTGSIPNGVFVPLPETNLLEVLSANANYTLFVAIVEKLGKGSLFTTVNSTILAVDNAVITDATGVTTVAEIEALDEVDDAGFIADLDEIIDRHIFPSVNFANRMFSLPSDITNQLGEEVLVASIGGSLVIVLDNTTPDVDNVAFVAVNTTASNGVIHEVDGLIIL
jgi:transforming growth factor-beta-induced protein